MRDPVTIFHPDAGTAVVAACAVPTWERAGWSTKPPAKPSAKRAPKTPAPRPAQPVTEPSAASAPTE